MESKPKNSELKWKVDLKILNFYGKSDSKLILKRSPLED